MCGGGVHLKSPTPPPPASGTCSWGVDPPPSVDGIWSWGVETPSPNTWHRVMGGSYQWSTSPQAPRVSACNRVDEYRPDHRHFRIQRSARSSPAPPVDTHNAPSVSQSPIRSVPCMLHHPRATRLCLLSCFTRSPSPSRTPWSWYIHPLYSDVCETDIPVLSLAPPTTVPHLVTSGAELQRPATAIGTHQMRRQRQAVVR